MMSEEDYKRGYDEGFRAALDTLQKVYVPAVAPTTTPFPPHYYDPWNEVCPTCRLSMSNKTNYICNIPNCPKNTSNHY
jgi:hypothetical protein